MSDVGIQYLVICIAMGAYYWFLTIHINDTKKEIEKLSEKIDELKEKSNDYNARE